MGRSQDVRAGRSGTRADIISAVGFDFDHTLGIDNKLERVAFLRLLEDACARGGRCLGTLAQEIALIDELLAQQRAGAFSIGDAVRRFVRERGAKETPDAVDAYERMTLAMVEPFVIAQPGLRGMLAQLKARGVPYAILTNGWSPLQQRKALHVGFDGPVLVSSEIGAQKPDPAAFAALARELGAPMGAIAYVGDSPEADVAGALRAGMQGIWFDAEGSTYAEELPAPSAVIHSLAELCTLT